MRRVVWSSIIAVVFCITAIGTLILWLVAGDPSVNGRFLPITALVLCLNGITFAMLSLGERTRP